MERNNSKRKHSGTALKAGAGALAAAMMIGLTGITVFAGPGDGTRHGRAAAPAAETAYIGSDKAQEIALNNAGLSRDQVTFLQTDLEWDDGLWQYDVEFYNPGDGTEYDYEIDATAGTILSLDYEAEYLPQPGGTGDASSYIGLDRAKSIALEKAGLTADQVAFKKARLDWDDGRAQYKIKFYYGAYEYEYEIDALKGTVLDFDRDGRD